MQKGISRLLVAVIACGLIAPVFAITTGFDARFGTGGIVLLGPTSAGEVLNLIWDMQIQNDGRIVVAGRTVRSGATLPAIGRLNADGSWDTSFAEGGLFVLPRGVAAAPEGGEFFQVAVLSDHSIVAAGSAFVDFIAFKTCTLLVKLTKRGGLDTMFAKDNSGSFCYDFAPATGTAPYEFYHTGLIVDSDNTFYLTSQYTNLSHGAVAHFDSHGVLVSDYGSAGIAALPDGMFSHLLRLTSQHRILAIGNTPTQIEVVRLDQGGAIDMSYGPGGSSVFDPQPNGGTWPIHAALDANQRLIVAINGYNLPYRFARLTDSGFLDDTFNGNNQQPGYPGLAIPVVSGESSDGLLALLPLPDGHIFAVGRSGMYPEDGTASTALLRLDGDSSYDRTYGDAEHAGWSSVNVGSGDASDTYPQALAADPWGRAFTAIQTTDAAGNYCTGLIRAIPDRLLDGSFDAPATMPTCPQ